MKKIHPSLWAVTGMILSLGYVLVGDWLYVKSLLYKNIIYLGDTVMWIIFCLLLLPLLFMSFYSRKNKVISSVLYTLIVGFAWAIICVFILLNFHFFIGGSK